MKHLTESQIKTIKKTVGYKGRKVRFHNFVPGMRVNSYWDGGSRDYWFLINLNSGAVKEIPQNGTPYDKLNLSCDKLGPADVLVLKPYYMGKVNSITIFS